MQYPVSLGSVSKSEEISPRYPFTIDLRSYFAFLMNQNNKEGGFQNFRFSQGSSAPSHSSENLNVNQIIQQSLLSASSITKTNMERNENLSMYYLPLHRPLAHQESTLITNIEPSSNSEVTSTTASATSIPFQQLFTVEGGGVRLPNGELVPQNSELSCYNWLSDVQNEMPAPSRRDLDLNEVPNEPVVKHGSSNIDESRVASVNEVTDVLKNENKRRKNKCVNDLCERGAAPPSEFCISHGGGRRCEHPECDKAKRAPSKFCRRHGGGKRCQKEGCLKAAISAYSFCARHGGGKRCCVPNCGKYAEPPTDKCKGHGGGPRCQVPNCTKSARRPTQFCSSHGGGKRCEVEGCGKAAVKHARCWMHGGKEMRKKAKEEKELAERLARQEIDNMVKEEKED